MLWSYKCFGIQVAVIKNGSFITHFSLSVCATYLAYHLHNSETRTCEKNLQTYVTSLHIEQLTTNVCIVPILKIWANF
jgi:hypothetical protein